MKRAGILVATILLALALAGCGASSEEQGSEEQTPAQEAEDNEVTIGGFSIEGPSGREISVPETTAEREDVEEYVYSVRPIIEESAVDLSRFVDPSADLQNETLTVSFGVEALEEARATVEAGLEDLQQLDPPESLEPVHELLVAAYVQGLSAYDNVIDAFESGDLDVLRDAVQENLPEIEQLTVEARSILQELERAQTVNSDDQAESRG
jgi:hypothetical protein